MSYGGSNVNPRKTGWRNITKGEFLEHSDFPKPGMWHRVLWVQWIHDYSCWLILCSLGKGESATVFFFVFPKNTSY